LLHYAVVDGFDGVVERVGEGVRAVKHQLKKGHTPAEEGS